MAFKVPYVIFITATLLALISSPARICVATNQGNPLRSPIGPQTDRPGNDSDVITRQTGLRVLAPSITQWPGSKGINNMSNEHYALSLDEPAPAILNFLPQPGSPPQSSLLAADEYAIADAGSHQRPATLETSRYGSRNPRSTLVVGYAQEIYDSWFSKQPNTREVTHSLLSGAATNLNPGNRFNANSLPSVGIDTEEAFYLNPWMYSIALIAFVLYARRRGSL